MFYNDDQINFLARILIEAVHLSGKAQFQDETRALKFAKDELRQYFQVFEDIDRIVRDKISKQTKSIIKGGREWEVLYQKYFREEANKRGL